MNHIGDEVALYLLFIQPQCYAVQIWTNVIGLCKKKLEHHIIRQDKHLCMVKSPLYHLCSKRNFKFPASRQLLVFSCSYLSHSPYVGIKCPLENKHVLNTYWIASPSKYHAVTQFLTLISILLGCFAFVTLKKSDRSLSNRRTGITNYGHPSSSQYRIFPSHISPIIYLAYNFQPSLF